MKSFEEKINVLLKIAKEANVKGLTWCVGSSLLLFFKGLVDIFNDIDIMVTEEDALEMAKILMKLGKVSSNGNRGICRSTYFFEGEVDGVDIDVFAGMHIYPSEEDALNDNNLLYDASLKKEHITDTIIVNGVKIPLCDISLWEKYYRFMNSENKANIIKEALLKRSAHERNS